MQTIARDITSAGKAAMAVRVMVYLLYFSLLGNAAMTQEPLLKSEYSYRQYTMQDGLPSMRCNVVFQDAKGFIWVGTESGFSRYDGINFANFFPDKNLNIYGFYEYEAGNTVAVGV